MRDDTNKIFIRLDIRRGVVASDFAYKNMKGVRLNEIKSSNKS